MELRITTLIENQEDAGQRLKCEHGLSLLLEIDHQKILFDTGLSGDFMKNAKNLGVSLEDVDYCILSHGHYDHTGGVTTFLDRIQNLPVFVVGEKVFLPKYKRQEDHQYFFNGNEFTPSVFAKNSVEVITIQEQMVSLSKNLLIFRDFPQSNEFEEINPRFFY